MLDNDVRLHRMQLLVQLARLIGMAHQLRVKVLHEIWVVVVMVMVVHVLVGGRRRSVVAFAYLSRDDCGMMETGLIAAGRCGAGCADGRRRGHDGRDHGSEVGWIVLVNVLKD